MEMFEVAAASMGIPWLELTHSCVLSFKSVGCWRAIVFGSLGEWEDLRTQVDFNTRFKGVMLCFCGVFDDGLILRK